MNNRNNILKVGGKNLNLENWKVYHPNGKHMFTCSGKKARWYLERDLAAHVFNEEFSIQLTFEPNGHGFSDNEEFGRSVREARCVVTGIKVDLQRHHIVPYCYRKYFPNIYKSKNHHDVVLINHDKHSEYEIEATKYKDDLAAEFKIKTIKDYNKAYALLLKENNGNTICAINNLNAIFSGYGKIPVVNIRRNLMSVSRYTNINYDLLLSFNYIQLYYIYLELKQVYNHVSRHYQQRHRQFYEHGYHLVRKLNTEDKMRNFITLWRKHFIETMNPQYMPVGWSIDFRIKTKL
jgi:exonuclease 3'-5' domain-containing protein 2